MLGPYQSLLYTWDDPTTERKLFWNVYNRKGKGFVADFTTVSVVSVHQGGMTRLHSATKFEIIFFDSQDGYGQEFVSFKLIKHQTPNTILKGGKLSSSFKKLASKYNADSSSSAEESDKMDNPCAQVILQYEPVL